MSIIPVPKVPKKEVTVENNFQKEEMSEKEKRVRAMTRIYYSNPRVQEAMFKFGEHREVAPRYFEAFGKRPDTLQYPSDIMGLVNKGATSFHGSEELWNNPLEIHSEMTFSEMQAARKGWDLLIDIDSPFLDFSKIAAELLLQTLERYGIESYGIKFSGSKGFHIIVPFKAFPEYFKGVETRLMFPEWARAIVEFLMQEIRPEYNKRIVSSGLNFEAIEERMHLKVEDLVSIACPNCHKPVEKTNFVHYKCERCNNPYSRPNVKVTKKKMRCTDSSCPGYMEVIKEEDYYFCLNCKTKLQSGEVKDTYGSKNSASTIIGTKESKSALVASEFKEELAGEKIASLDLVLVASRHLFRMPYSLHEKTALASIVLEKNEIKNFTPKDANPLKATIKQFYKDAKNSEAAKLLEAAVSWKGILEAKTDTIRKDYVSQPSDYSGVTEDMFPDSIKRLQKGLEEGRKRGLFVLITFLRSLNFPDEKVYEIVHEWNKKNTPPLKEGYIRTQLDWHTKQQKKILPPNYKNDNFYKDLKLITEYPIEKNPLVEVMKKLYKKRSNQ